MNIEDFKIGDRVQVIREHNAYPSAKMGRF